jgi:hypothetical protein
MRKFLLVLAILVASSAAMAQSIVLSQNFESITNSGDPLTGWAFGNTQTWNVATYGHNSDKYAGWNESTNADQWIRTPKITNPGFLTFWVAMYSSATNLSLKVQISSDSVNWVDKGTFVSQGAGGDIGFNYIQKTVPIQMMGSYYIRWQTTNYVSGGFYIDDVVVLSAILNKTAIDFGSHAVGSTTTDSVMVMNTGADTLKAAWAAYGDTAFVVTAAKDTLLPGDSAKVYVGFSPKVLGPKKGGIVFTSTSGSSPDTVKLTGTTPVPVLSLSQKVFNDTVLVAVIKRDTIKVKNPGTAPLTVKAVLAPSDTTFKLVQPDSLTVAAGDSGRIVFTFQASYVATSTAKIYFATNAGNDTVSMTGNGMVYTIAQARTKTSGVVAVIGTVTRAQGPNLVIQQDTTAGLLAYQTSGSMKDSITSGYIKTGSKILLTGTVSPYKNLFELQPVSYWKVIGTDSTIRPFQVNLATLRTNGERYESMLIQVPNLTLVVSVDTVWASGKSYWVVDPSDTTKKVVLRTPTTANSPKFVGSKIPVSPFVFNGVFGQFATVVPPDTGYQLTAWYPTDVVAQSPVTLSSRTFLDTTLVALLKKDSVLVKNTTGVGPLALKATIVSADTAFKLLKPDSLSLAAGDSAKLYFTYQPTLNATTTAKIYLRSILGTDSIAISGTGSVYTIPQIRALTPGTYFASIGTVTRAQGRYVVVQQDTTAGFTLFETSGSLKDSAKTGYVKTGTKLLFAGKATLYNNLLEISGAANVALWRVIGTDSTIKPLQVTLAKLRTNGERYESMLVQVSGISISTTDTAWKAGTSYLAVDASDTLKQVPFRTPAASDSSKLIGAKIPKGPLQYTGIVGQFSSAKADSGYQMTAFYPTDITTLTSVNDQSVAASAMPVEYSLSQNYPNPFNPSTKIDFALPKASTVELKVYNMLGQEVAALAGGTMSAGRHTVTFNANRLASGMYIYRLVAGNYVSVRKMLLVK